jgi:hypothetical protein
MGFNLNIFHDVMMDIACLGACSLIRGSTCCSPLENLPKLLQSLPLFPELGVQLVELLEVGYVTPGGDLSRTLLHWLRDVRGRWPP